MQHSLGNLFKHIHHQNTHFMFSIWPHKHGWMVEFFNWKKNAIYLHRVVFFQRHFPLNQYGGITCLLQFRKHFDVRIMPLCKFQVELTPIRNITQLSYDIPFFSWISIPTESETSYLGVAAGSIVVQLKQIPNQPIIFKVRRFSIMWAKWIRLFFIVMKKKADPSQESRTEDAVIAWTWKVFMETNGSNPYILLRMPMTKVWLYRVFLYKI